MAAACFTKRMSKLIRAVCNLSKPMFSTCLRKLTAKYFKVMGHNVVYDEYKEYILKQMCVLCDFIDCKSI